MPRKGDIVQSLVDWVEDNGLKAVVILVLIAESSLGLAFPAIGVVFCSFAAAGLVGTGIWFIREGEIAGLTAAFLLAYIAIIGAAWSGPRTLILASLIVGCLLIPVVMVISEYRRS